ncbi:MAG: energy-coupling factor ABC transporter ATP-binding protein [Chloroflexota bacterium]
MNAIELAGVVHRYPGADAPALDGLDLAIATGTSVALMGRNGSGKSTLLAHLVGILRPDAGRVAVGGRDTAGLRVAELARIVGVAGQDPARQIVARRVADEVAFGPRMLGMQADACAASVAAALAATGLAERAAENPWDLGPAERRLLALASVLAMRTPIVVLDEPTAGLDDRERERVGGIAASSVAEGRTLLVATHDVRFAAERTERIVVLAGGRVAWDGAPAGLPVAAAAGALADAGLAPPPVALLGARLGLGPTPTDGTFAAAVRAREAGSPLA